MTELSNERLAAMLAWAECHDASLKEPINIGDFIGLITEILSLRQSHSTGAVVNAALVERFQSAYRAAGQKRNWHPTWPDAEASFEILSALYPHPKEAEVTVTEEMVERALRRWFGESWPNAVPGNPDGVFDDMRAALVAALSRKG